MHSFLLPIYIQKQPTNISADGLARRVAELLTHPAPRRQCRIYDRCGCFGSSLVLA